MRSPSTPRSGDAAPAGPSAPVDGIWLVEVSRSTVMERCIAPLAWRPGVPRGSRPRRPRQVHVRHLGGLWLGVEEVAPREPERARDQDAGEGRDGAVVVQHRSVVVLTREADLVLGRGQLLLEAQDVLVRLQFGVVLTTAKSDRRCRSGCSRRGLSCGPLGAGGHGVGASLRDLGRGPPARSPCSPSRR